MIISQCTYCQRSDNATNTCSAFPSGIPEQILLNQISHQKQYPGDQGKIFKPKDDVSSEELKLLKFSKTSETVVA